MSAPLYLDMLDQLLHPSVAELSKAFVDAQVRFVAGCQQADGGFGGRQGGSDFYYTDFAVRTLALLAPEHAALDRAAGYVVHLPRPPQGTIECFNVLNLRRLLASRLAIAVDGVPTDDSSRDPTCMGQSPWTFAPSFLLDQLGACLLPGGGLARSAGDPRASAYHTFLGELCFQMLGVDIPAAGRSVAAVEALRQPDGGFAELAGQTASQTSATAAAVAVLMMHDALSPAKIAEAAQSLACMQSVDGGLKPHAAVESGDLLSTFTGLTTLWALGGMHLVDLASVAKFLRSTAHPAGGFVSSAGDDTADVEYAYYGVSTLALLRGVLPGGSAGQ
jgi:geranylgeranyl transferase type-2 subunit beta